MNNNYFLYAIIAIVTIVLLLYLKFSASKSDDSNNKTILSPVPVGYTNLEAMIRLLLRVDIANSFEKYVAERMQSGEFSDEADFFISQEIINHMYDNDVLFYGFFDWKEESEEFDLYIRKALRDNFSVEFSEHLCDLDKWGSIDKVYKVYGEYLEKLGYALCNIDTGGDSYQIVIVRSVNAPMLRHRVEAIGLRFETYDMKW